MLSIYHSCLIPKGTVIKILLNLDKGFASDKPKSILFRVIKNKQKKHLLQINNLTIFTMEFQLRFKSHNTTKTLVKNKYT